MFPFGCCWVVDSWGRGSARRARCSSFCSCWGFAYRGRDSPRRARYFSLLRQRKVPKRKATLLSASLRFATGQPAVLGHGAALRNSLRCFAAPF
ncbi:MAG: hypothetical protein EOO32_06870 [Comamonadaceae bacterium]|nr:MAG: hypothetical protein EOO32_06870 [Comamonadaceae bacterium]